MTESLKSDLAHDIVHRESVIADSELWLSGLLDKSLDPLFWPADRIDPLVMAWLAHVPFAHWLMSQLKPRLLVELGTHSGVSYSAFCSAIIRERLITRAFAIDTWKGDDHAGTYGEDVFEDFRRYHDARYRDFSSLLRTTFDDALDEFQDASIDLLHIDGLHTYEAVKHDFEAWFPKLSPEAVVLLHDTNVRDRGFGVWRLWAELSERYPAFEFVHSLGLGVLCVGPNTAPPLLALCALRKTEDISRIRGRFAAAGERWSSEAEGKLRLEAAQHQVRSFAESLASMESIRGENQRLAAELANAVKNADTLQQSLRTANDSVTQAGEEIKALGNQNTAIQSELSLERKRTAQLEGTIENGVRELLCEKDRAKQLETALDDAVIAMSALRKEILAQEAILEHVNSSTVWQWIVKYRTWIELHRSSGLVRFYDTRVRRLWGKTSSDAVQL